MYVANRTSPGFSVQAESKPSSLYLNRPFSGAVRLRLVKPISNRSLPGEIVTPVGGAACNASGFCRTPSNEMDSMITGGALVLSLSESGLTDATPLIVGNQSLPSVARHAAGWKPELHSPEGKPSASPKERNNAVLLFPAEISLRSFF